MPSSFSLGSQWSTNIFTKRYVSSQWKFYLKYYVISSLASFLSSHLQVASSTYVCFSKHFFLRSYQGSTHSYSSFTLKIHADNLCLLLGELLHSSLCHNTGFLGFLRTTTDEIRRGDGRVLLSYSWFQLHSSLLSVLCIVQKNQLYNYAIAITMGQYSKHYCCFAGSIAYTCFCIAVACHYDSEICEACNFFNWFISNWYVNIYNEEGMCNVK